MEIQMPIIGLVGGLASGKSSVAAEFAKLGCAIIDADKLAHQCLLMSTLKGPLVDLLGPIILNGSGVPDRKKIAKIVFNDPQTLSSLNKIIHPEVLQETERLIRIHSQDTRIKAIVLDMPLLLEVGWDKKCDRVIFVACDKQTRMARARTNRQMSETEFKMRENFQISLDTKLLRADNSVNNISSVKALAKQVACIFSDIINC
jgi:dephospho-CoA kinase